MSDVQAIISRLKEAVKRIHPDNDAGLYFFTSEIQEIIDEFEGKE